MSSSWQQNPPPSGPTGGDPAGYQDRQSGWQQPTWPAPAPTVAAGNGLGRASLTLGLATVALQGGLTLMTVWLFASDRYSVYEVLQRGVAILGAGLAISAVVTGIVGLRRPGLPRGSAAAGLALGGSWILTVTASLLSTLLFRYI